MNNPKAVPPGPWFFQPMIQNDDYAGCGAQGWSAQAIAQGWNAQGSARAWSAQSAHLWEATWGRNSSQTMAPHIPANNQADTPLVLREAARQSVVNTVVVTESLNVRDSVNIAPKTVAIQLEARVAAKATVTSQLTLTPAAAVKPRLARAPAARLISVLSSVATRSAYERIFAPLIAQEQHEHYEALVRKDYRRASFIVGRLYVMSILISIRVLLTLLAKLFKGQ